MQKTIAFGVSLLLLAAGLSVVVASVPQHEGFTAATVAVPRSNSPTPAPVERSAELPSSPEDGEPQSTSPVSSPAFASSPPPALSRLQSLLERERWSVVQRLFSARLYTRCGEVEKNTSILYGLLLPIDVDDDSGTGENGNDLRTRFFILPSLSQEDMGWVLAFHVVVEVERLGEEIKDLAVEVALDLTLNLAAYDYGTHSFRLGYISPEDKELPQRERLTFTVYPYLVYDRGPDFVLEHAPVFSGPASDVDVVARYTGSYGGDVFSHQVTLGFAPAVQATLRFTPQVDRKSIALSLSREAAQGTVLTIAYDGETNDQGMHIAFTIDELPQSMAFSLGYSLNGEGGSIAYDSSQEFNVTLTIRMDRAELMGCMQIAYLPTHLAAEWQYRILNGYLDVNTSASDTTFVICDSLEDPSIRFSVSNITRSLHLTWNIAEEGYVLMDADRAGPRVDFSWITGSLHLQSSARMNADYFRLAWNIAEEGYVNLDTNDQFLATFTFNFTVNDNIGLRIGASFLRAQDFSVQWVVWPPAFQTSGDIQFAGDFHLSVMLGGTWYALVLA